MPRTRQGPPSPSPEPEKSTADIPEFSANDILIDRSTANVRTTANWLALDFAILGRVDVAVRIQELLHNRDYIPEGMYDGAGNYWPSLNFAYEAAGLRPPFMDDDDILNERQKKEVAWIERECFQNAPNFSDPIQGNRYRELEEKLRRIFGDGMDKFPEDEVVATMKAMSDMCRRGSWQTRALRTRMIDYMMEKGREEEALAMLDPIVEAIKDSWTNRLCDEVPRLRYAWRVWVTGVLRGKLRVDEQALEKKGQQLIETLEKRLRDGPITRPLEGNSTDELIDMIDASLHGPKHQNANRLRNPPATDEDIAAAEARLGMPLPEDFKEFLRISNGFQDHNYKYDIGVIIGTKYISWGDPLIEEYTLEILPAFEVAASTDIDEVELPRVVELSSSGGSGDYVYLVEPARLEEGRWRLRAYYDEEDEDMKRLIDGAVENFYGGWVALDSLEWGVICFEQYESHFVGSFRMWLEDLAIEAKGLRK